MYHRQIHNISHLLGTWESALFIYALWLRNLTNITKREFSIFWHLKYGGCVETRLAAVVGVPGVTQLSCTHQLDSLPTAPTAIYLFFLFFKRNTRTMDTIIMTSAAGPEAESQHRVAGVTSHLPHGAVRTADDETVVENFFFKVKHKSASSAIFLIFPIDNY